MEVVVLIDLGEAHFENGQAISSFSGIPATPSMLALLYMLHTRETSSMTNSLHCDTNRYILIVKL